MPIGASIAMILSLFVALPYLGYHLLQEKTIKAKKRCRRPRNKPSL
jgi:hypothetical protein